MTGTIIVALAYIGQVRGWMHGMFRDTIVSVLRGHGADAT
jgi:hypothetical protein